MPLHYIKSLADAGKWQGRGQGFRRSHPQLTGLQHYVEIDNTFDVNGRAGSRVTADEHAISAYDPGKQVGRVAGIPTDRWASGAGMSYTGIGREAVVAEIKVGGPLGAIESKIKDYDDAQSERGQGRSDLDIRDPQAFAVLRRFLDVYPWAHHPAADVPPATSAAGAYQRVDALEEIPHQYDTWDEVLLSGHRLTAAEKNTLEGDSRARAIARAGVVDR